ncbi:hypothetical protein L6164_013541 [Bauhinia variegata]|uniref:Uncharacterized protein n=1 Tax=Bauhinia variegata TaxID=167791 RepID=A0ACB9NFW5_BAUVA|nr:hypothetical protein L6164_013541 [Bauhinia variegata]
MPNRKSVFGDFGPHHLADIDWQNLNHRRCVMASLVQGTKILERDRQKERLGPRALAPPWYEFFHFDRDASRSRQRLAGWILSRAAITLLAAKEMAKMSDQPHLETYLFNPPFISLSLEWIENQELKRGINVTRTFLRGAIAVAKSAVVGLMADGGYFENREEMKKKGMGGLEMLASRENDPLVVTFLDGSTLRLFLKDEDDFAMLAQNLFPNFDFEDKGKISKSEMRNALVQMGVEMGVPPFSGPHVKLRVFIQTFRSPVQPNKSSISTLTDKGRVDEPYPIDVSDCGSFLTRPRKMEAPLEMPILDRN